MTTFEILGVTLALLPLIVSAAEHYEDCFRPFNRYRQFTTKVKRFEQEFDIQKTIFHNQCRILLGNVVEKEIAIAMLREREHPLWCDTGTENSLVNLLNHSHNKKACMNAIGLIDEELQRIEKEVEGFGVVLDESGESHVDGGKDWRHRTGKKLKFAFSNSRLKESLETLTNLNDNFVCLSKQIAKLNGGKPPNTSTSPSIQDREVVKYRDVQTASKFVYEALGRACTKHTDHLACFRIDVHCSSERSTTSQIKFDVAFSHQPLTGSGTAVRGDPIWFVIESILNDTENSKPTTMVPEVFDLTHSLKRDISNVSGPVGKRAKKSVRFCMQAEPESCRETELHPPPPENLWMRKDFCTHLLNHYKQPKKLNGCIGLLDSTGGCKHLIYFPSKPISSTFQAKTLEQLFRILPKLGRRYEIPQYKRLQLARSLATAVLQYHATPWLNDSWRSGDIYFVGLDEKSLLEGSTDLSSPHLNVKIKGPNEQMSLTATTSHPGYIKNRILFGLGVLLIELAHLETLDNLKEPHDGEDEFFTAKRLASSIGREMGSSYGRIVENCLDSSSGVHYDLNSPAVQNMYYRDVVCELSKLADGFRDLQLGP